MNGKWQKFVKVQKTCVWDHGNLQDQCEFQGDRVEQVQDFNLKEVWGLVDERHQVAFAGKV